MISINTRRFGPIVVAATCADNHQITLAIGLTANAAEQRLIKQVTR